MRRRADRRLDDGLEAWSVRWSGHRGIGAAVQGEAEVWAAEGEEGCRRARGGPDDDKAEVRGQRDVNAGGRKLGG